MDSETPSPNRSRVSLSEEGSKMDSDTSRGHQSETASTSARNPARIIAYTIALRRAYNAQKPQPSLYARSTDIIDSHTVAMDESTVSTINSASPSGSGPAGNFTLLAIRGDSQYSNTSLRIDTFIKTPDSFNGSSSQASLVIPPTGRRNAASEPAIPSLRPVDGWVSSKRRKTIPLGLGDLADHEEHENTTATPSEQLSAEANRVLSIYSSPPTPPYSTRTSHKSSTTFIASTCSTTTTTEEKELDKAKATPQPSLSTAPPTPTTPSSPNPTIPPFIPLPERADPIGTYARSIAHLTHIFTRHSLTTRAARRAYLHSLPHAQYADAARWLYLHRADLWDSADEEAAGFSPLVADEYCGIMGARLAKTGVCWEWVCLYGAKRGSRVEVVEAQIGLFGVEWGVRDGRWGGRVGGEREGEVGPRGEGVGDL